MAGPPGFLASFSKSRLFLSKDFQRFLWRFCVISTGYKGKKSKVSASKFFRRAGLVVDAFPAPWRRIPPTRAARGRARSVQDRERLRRTVAGGGFIVEHRCRSREV